MDRRQQSAGNALQIHFCRHEESGPARRSLGEGGSPRNLFAITQEFTGEILRRFAGKPDNRVRAFLH